MFRLIREIIDAIKWARRKMLAEREESLFQVKISDFLTQEVLPAWFRYKTEHGHAPKYLLLPMQRLTDIHRATRERFCDMIATWNGEEDEGGWSFSDEDPQVAG